MLVNFSSSCPCTWQCIFRRRLTKKDASTSLYLKKTDQNTADKAKQKLRKLLQEAKDNHIFTDEENDAKCPNGKIFLNFTALKV